MSTQQPRAVIEWCREYGAVLACSDCGDDDVRLERHHLRYFTQAGHLDPDDPGGLPIHGRETDDDINILCRDCHHGRHVDSNGDFWRDPEEKEDFWRGPGRDA